MRLTHAIICVIALWGCGCSFLDTPNANRPNQGLALMAKLVKEPDLPHWYEQRKKITLAMGDRVFDKSFDEVFDALTIALGTMEVSVSNMERRSGFIAANGRMLPPMMAKQLRHNGLVEYCRHHGFDPSLLDTRGDTFGLDPDMMGSMLEKITLTISLVRQSEMQTKVKLRFSGIYYPEVLQKHYEIVWPALDKQIFLDRNLD
jgi:hypothetical protein